MMSRIVIKQPNGLYCQWSTIVDSIVVYNQTRQDIIDDWLEDEKERIVLETDKIIKALDDKNNPWHEYYASKEWKDLSKKVRESILNGSLK